MRIAARVIAEIGRFLRAPAGSSRSKGVLLDRGLEASFLSEAIEVFRRARAKCVGGGGRCRLVQPALSRRVDAVRQELPCIASSGPRRLAARCDCSSRRMISTFRMRGASCFVSPFPFLLSLTRRSSRAVWPRLLSASAHGVAAAWPVRRRSPRRIAGKPTFVGLEKLLRQILYMLSAILSRRQISAIDVSLRRPSSRILIFTSAEYCSAPHGGCFLKIRSEDFSGYPDFCLIFPP